ncbi:hypothetical protein GGR36_004359 [Niveibacterium umoris]|uniref:Uncharacterized protein n=1 Tax=Niveibacterium umoris TaxID=1193620 RepID=A0A840BNA0_9RHOO|nr:hypothetical protein [Niveibacterium umoris]
MHLDAFVMLVVIFLAFAAIPVLIVYLTYLATIREGQHRPPNAHPVLHVVQRAYTVLRASASEFLGNKSVYFIAGPICTVSAYRWAYGTTQGDFASSLKVAASIAAVFPALWVLLNKRREHKVSELTDDQLILQRAGTAENLERQARNTRICAHAIAALPILAGVLAAQKSAAAGIEAGLLLAIFIGPLAGHCYLSSRKAQRIAAQSRAGSPLQATPNDHGG